MIRTRSGIPSTRNNRAEILDARLQVDDLNPPQYLQSKQEQTFFYASLADNINGVMYSDLTGRFPAESYRGMQYIFIAYIYDENLILMRTMKKKDRCMYGFIFQRNLSILKGEKM